MKPTQLARKTLEEYFEDKNFYLDEKTIKEYKNKKASFITLTKNSQLRGCIGSLIPNQELWKDIQKNTLNAAFKDPRFPRLEKQELDQIKIEVSILSKPKEIKFSNDKELLNKINKDMGIILTKGFNTSTFLPQVWEQIPEKTQFLQALSQKAGLPKDAWKTANIEYYTVEKFKE